MHGLQRTQVERVYAIPPGGAVMALRLIGRDDWLSCALSRGVMAEEAEEESRPVWSSGF